jgi:hypothetical protein
MGGSTGAPKIAGDAEVTGGCGGAPRVKLAVGAVTTGRVVDSEEDAIAVEESTARRAPTAVEDDGGTT